MPDIRLIEVSKSYGAVPVCRGINLDVRDREFVTLLGSSGCGKTTTLNMIAGLDDVTSGEIQMSGRRVNGLEPIARDVAMVFQNYALYPHMTVAQNIGFNLRLKGAGKTEIAARVGAAAASLDLSHLLERFPSQLSGGQQQRVAIGRAIVREPKVFLFDEPFSNLDAALRNRMRGEVRQLHARLGVTSIFVTHDQEEALSISDRIAVMRAGAIEQFGSPEEVYARPTTSFVARFIGNPQVDILPGTISSEADRVYLLCGEASLALNRRQAHVLLSRGGEFDFTIRPEHVRLADSGIACIVKDVQPLGPSTMVGLEWPGGTVTARLNGIVHLAPGSRVHAQFDAAELMFFDRGSGHRIEIRD